METKKYNKLALIGFIVGPVSIVLIEIMFIITSRIFKMDPNADMMLLFPFAIMVPVSLILALVSLFMRKEDQKGKELAIITLIFPIIFFQILPLIFSFLNWIIWIIKSS